ALRQRAGAARLRRLAAPGAAADPARPLADQRPPRRHPLLPSASRGRDLDQVEFVRRGHDSQGNGARLHRAGLVAGRPRLAYGQGPALPRARRDLGTGAGAADRRAVLQVTGSLSEHAYARNTCPLISRSLASRLRRWTIAAAPSPSSRSTRASATRSATASAAS